MVLPAHEDQVGLVIKLATKKEGQAEVGKKKFEELSNQWFEPRGNIFQFLLFSFRLLNSRNQ